MFRVSAISTLVLLLLIVGSVVAILAERKFKLQSPVHVPATQNECLDAIMGVANNSYVYRVVHKYGGFLGARKMKKPMHVNTVTDREYLKDTDEEFLEGSWCNRNANWHAWLFVGDRITDPEETMYSAREWQQDLRTFLAKEAPKERRLMYLVTVPKLNNVPETSKYFFYNTHWFVVQVIVPEDYDVSKDIDYVDKMKLHKFRIYAGFARHYRSIDYLHEWPQNANIPPNHRLKIARNNWAGVDISFDKFMDEFLEKSQQFMDEINDNMAWTLKANDLHAELWYADKFKDMVILKRREEAKAAANKTAAAVPDGTPSGDDTVVVVSTGAEDTTAPRTDQVPYFERWNTPLAVPSDGSYKLVVRRFHYKSEDCTRNANVIMHDVYGKLHHSPATPLILDEEEYDN